MKTKDWATELINKRNRLLITKRGLAAFTWVEYKGDWQHWIDYCRANKN